MSSSSQFRHIPHPSEYDLDTSDSSHAGYQDQPSEYDLDTSAYDRSNPRAMGASSFQRQQRVTVEDLNHLPNGAIVATRLTQHTFVPSAHYTPSRPLQLQRTPQSYSHAYDNSLAALLPPQQQVQPQSSLAVASASAASAAPAVQSPQFDIAAGMEQTVNDDGREFQSAWGLFHAKKIFISANDPNQAAKEALIEELMSVTSDQEGQDLIDQNTNLVRSDWKTVERIAMRDVLVQVVKEHDDVRQALLDSGTSRLSGSLYGTNKINIGTPWTDVRRELTRNNGDVDQLSAKLRDPKVVVAQPKGEISCDQITKVAVPALVGVAGMGLMYLYKSYFG